MKQSPSSGIRDVQTISYVYLTGVCITMAQAVYIKHEGTTTWAQLLGVSQHKDDRVSTEKHLADESISVDWLGALLALASLWDLQQGGLRSAQCTSNNLCVTKQVLPTRPCKAVAAQVKDLMPGQVSVCREMHRRLSMAIRSRGKHCHTSVHISFTFSRIMLQCLSNALMRPSSFLLLRQLISTYRDRQKCGSLQSRLSP